MTKTQLFTAAMAAGIILVALGILTAVGVLLGHKVDGPLGINHMTHTVLFVVLGLIAFVFAAATRPTGAGS